MPKVKRTLYAVKSGESILNWFENIEVAKAYGRLYENTTIEKQTEYEPDTHQVWAKADEPDNLPT